MSDHSADGGTNDPPPNRTWKQKGPWTMPKWEMDEEIVISGISGRFPETENMDQLKKNLFGGIDMISENDKRWRPGYLGTPKRFGKLKDISHFDALFFGVHGRMADVMDPQQRLLLESTYEAIFDAGYDPASLRGRSIGVFIGCSEPASSEIFRTDRAVTGYELLGFNLGMMSNRISFSFDFKGPSLTLDTACSATFTALNEAILALRTNRCESAIVGGANITLEPHATVAFLKIGMISPEGNCKVFDDTANGFVRSEGAGVLFLQRKSQARRVYATILHCKINNDGCKAEGITYPDAKMHRQLYREVYSELDLDPLSIHYLEAHGTGTVAGDKEETNGIAEFFLPGREEPLLIGSVKSNMGHGEAGSGLQSMAKVIIAMEEKAIPPNLQYSVPNTDTPALIDGTLKVVTEVTPFTHDLMAISNFGFGGSNVHAVLRANPKEPMEMKTRIIPRLVLACGRLESSVQYIFQKVEEDRYTDEAITLLEEASKAPTVGMRYRGYALAGNPWDEMHVHIEKSKTEHRPVWFLFSGMGSQWSGMAKEMMKLDAFAKSIRMSAQVLEPYGIDLIHLLTEATEKKLEYIVAPFVAIAAVQVALVDTVRSLGIEPHGIVGHSLGELGCAYADGCFTAEQMLKVAYWRGKSCADTKLIKGAMAAVGLSWEEANRRCPEGVFPVCHNSDDLVTISGPAEDVKTFVQELKGSKVFAKIVKTCDIAFHSKYVEPASHKMRKELEKIIPHPLPRSSRWVSSSVPESDWKEPRAQLSSVEYHINNLLSPVLFNEAMSKIPKNALVIEFAPHYLLKAMVTEKLGPESTYIGLMKRGHEDNVEHFLEAVGKMYISNLNPQARNLYEPVEFPVSRGTPMLGAAIKWDHTTTWDVSTFESVHNSRDVYTVDTMKGFPEDYFVDHKVDGRVLFPAMGYVYAIWNVMCGAHLTEVGKQPIIFEDVMFHRATLLPKNGVYRIRIHLMKKSGVFELLEGDMVVMSGKTRFQETDILRLNDEDLDNPEDTEETFVLNSTDFYKEMRLRCYEYGPKFQGVIEADSSGSSGLLKWEGRWVTFMDAMLQLPILALPKRALLLPTRIKSIRIDPSKMPENPEEGIPCKFSPTLNILKAGPVEMQGLGCGIAPRSKNVRNEPALEKHIFVPFYDFCTLTEKEQEEVEEYSHVCATLAHKILQQSEDRKEEMSSILNGFEKAPEELVEEYLQRKEKNHVLLRILKETLDPTVEEDNTADSDDEKDSSEPILSSSDTTISNHGQLYNQSSYSSDSNITKVSRVSNTLKIEELERSIEDKLLSLEEKYRAALAKHRDIYDDKLTTVPLRETGLRAVLDIVQDNTRNRINILEVSVNSVICKDVVRMLSMTSLGMLRIDYNVARATHDEVPEGVLIGNAVCTQCDLDKPLPGGHHLVVSKDLITDSTRGIGVTIKSLAEAVKYGGFLLVIERTHLSPAENIVAAIMGKKRQVQTERQLEEAFVSAGLTIICKKKDQVTSVTYLLRKLADTDMEIPHVINVSHNENHLWINELRELLKVEYAEFEKAQVKPDVKSIENGTGTIRLGQSDQCESTNDILKQVSLDETENTIENKGRQQPNNINSNQISHGFEYVEGKKEEMAADTEIDKFVKPVEGMKSSDPRVTDTRNIWLIASQQDSGILGLYNCLRTEPGGKKLRLFFDVSLDTSFRAPDFDLSNEKIKHVMKCDLNINMYKDGQWGRMSYRLLGTDAPLQDRCSSFMSVTNLGDLSSVKWIESPLKYFDFTPQAKPSTLVQVYYAAINFRDVMFASGKLPPDAIPGPQALQECILGLEYSGKDATGRRVMGIQMAQALANTVSAIDEVLMEVPDEWTLEEASTVPVVYLTAYYALITRGQMEEGESILIHCGSGGVGLAAINIALHLKCQVFITVGSEEKERYLKELYPELKHEQFCNSRDSKFEYRIMKTTGGKGVDLVLNSLSDDKMQASIRCLKVHGRFLEIGKYDAYMDSKLGMSLFLRDITFHGIFLDTLFDNTIKRDGKKGSFKKCIEELKKGIKSGAVKPLKANVYDWNQGEDAFRFMASGKHMGKVVIKIRDEEPDRSAKPVPFAIPSVARTYCHPEKSYIVTGGLGGFGFELVNWLVDKGARHILVSSRTALKSGYQKLWYGRWLKAGVEVKISNKDITSEQEAKDFIKEGQEMAPLEGIFHLAMVLHDGLFGKLTTDDFNEAWNPKAKAANFLDLYSRALCPDMKYFVVFSSIVCGRGNPGQSNYAYANSAMERLVEQRKHQGLHGLSIQWGGVGDVGFVYEHMGGNEVNLKNSVPQRINSCLSTLDRLLQEDHAIVSSFVPSEKAAFGNYCGKDLIEMLCNVLGIKDPSTVKGDMSLGELGMDSIMGVEIKQTLETDHDCVMTVPEVRQLTIKELRAIEEKKKGADMEQDDAHRSNADNYMPVQKAEMVIPTKILVPLNQVKGQIGVFFVHSLERHTEMLRNLAVRLQKPAYGLQFTEEVPHNTVQDIAACYVQHVKQVQPHGPYHLVGHLFGSLVALEMAVLLQKTDQVKSFISIDSSPAVLAASAKNWLGFGPKLAKAPFKLIAQTYFKEINKDFEIQIETEIMFFTNSSDMKINRFVQLMGLSTPKSSLEKVLEHFIRIATAAKDYKPRALFRGKTTLVKATLTDKTPEVLEAREHDYGMKQSVDGSVEVLEIKCFQSQIVNGKADATALIINSRIQD